MTVTWKNIEDANAGISTTDIKGKNYAEVAQRVKAFRKVYPTGKIETEMTSLADGIYIFRATAGYYEDDGRFVLLATETAREDQKASYINKTSYIENGETSAVGRCLGFCGFGIETSICSADELANALRQQEVEQRNEKPVNNKGKVQNEEKDFLDVIAESEEDEAYRTRLLEAFGKKKLDAACMNRFKTEFEWTPVSELKKIEQLRRFA